jgi:hypothetical protein
MNSEQDTLMQQLQPLLEAMDACARRLEQITEAEYDAIRSLDADLILNTGRQRIEAHQELVMLEQQSRALLEQHCIPERMTLSAVIDQFAGQQKSRFQALRSNLYERIVKVDRQSQENRIRLQAAYSVSTTILQSLGLAQGEQTYQRRAAG